jgi:3-dehydrosphinganine reductase
MNPYYSQKRVLVTGGSSGIGLAIARQLAAAGAHVWILARRPELLAQAVHDIEQQRASPQQVVGSIAADVTDEHAITARLGEFCAQNGVPDFLFNCAGIAHPGTFEETGLDIYRSMMETNYFGTLYPTKAIVPGMVQRKSGHIVNFASIAGFLSVYGYTAYGASKAAIKGLTGALRAEMRLHGIHVSLVYPADTKTPQLDFEKALEPEITKILAGSKPITAEYAAKVVINGVAHRRFAITPGFDATLYYVLLSIAGWFEPQVMDFLIDQARKKVNSG